jgi:hypothetical protein
MATITTKYSVGDVVYHAGTTTEGRKHPCPDCNGTRHWMAKSPAGDDFSFACPRCAASYSARDELSLSYTAFTPNIQRLTIGSVRYDSHSYSEGAVTEYMCHETGVGSGSIYKETDLFASEEDALRVAEIRSSHANETTEWVAKRYNRTLSLSDYQLSSAMLENAEREKSKARSMLYNIGDLFATIREASDKEAILEAVEEYERWHMDDDRRAASVDTHPKDGDVKQAPLVSGAVPNGETPT